MIHTYKAWNAAMATKMIDELEVQIARQRELLERATREELTHTQAMALALRGKTPGDHCRQQIAALEAQRDRRDAAIQAHATAEAEHAADLVELGLALRADRQVLADAVEATIAALSKLWDAAVAFDGQVGEAAEVLRDAGLDAAYRDGDVEVRFETGGWPADGESFAARRLVLNGEAWHRITPRAVLGYAMAEALASHGVTRSGPASRDSAVRRTLDPVVDRPTAPANTR